MSKEICNSVWLHIYMCLVSKFVTKVCVCVCICVLSVSSNYLHTQLWADLHWAVSLWTVETEPEAITRGCYSTVCVSVSCSPYNWSLEVCTVHFCQQPCNVLLQEIICVCEEKRTKNRWFISLFHNHQYDGWKKDFFYLSPWTQSHILYFHCGQSYTIANAKSWIQCIAHDITTSLTK